MFPFINLCMIEHHSHAFLHLPSYKQSLLNTVRVMSGDIRAETASSQSAPAYADRGYDI